MVRKNLQGGLLAYLLLIIISCKSTVTEKAVIDPGELSLKASASPVRPGVPGEVPFWNQYAKRFIYAPAFDFKEVEGAGKYRYEILSLSDSSEFSFESDVPYAALSPVWPAVPTGYFKLKVVGLSPEGNSLGSAGKGRYYRAAPFDGVYHEPRLPYDSSAMLALDRLMHKDYVDYWMIHNSPDPDYKNYEFPAKIWSALIIGAVTHARLKPDTPDAQRSTALAEIIADYLIKVSFPKGTPWEFFPPTYYGERLEKHPIPNKPHMRVTTNFAIIGADAGNAYLDLYDHTGKKKYLEAAKRIAVTYQKTQLSHGSWNELVHYKTGKPIAEPIAIPTAIINYYDRLRRDYGVKGLEESKERALNWVMENPVKTFDWHGQFEDIKPREAYQNQSREQACDLAIYLFKNKTDQYSLKLAKELIRFSEDQFVIWEKPAPLPEEPKNPGRNPANWITPSVQEQYVFWQPVGRAAGIMIQTYWEAYAATKEKVYLEKARSIANAFTLVQEANNGDYTTFFTSYPLPLWLNSTVYPAKILMDLNKNLAKVDDH